VRRVVPVFVAFASAPAFNVRSASSEKPRRKAEMSSASSRCSVYPATALTRCWSLAKLPSYWRRFSASSDVKLLRISLSVANWLGEPMRICAMLLNSLRP
jgi:hypothetical protein